MYCVLSDVYVRYLELPDSKKRRGVLPSPTNVKRRKVQVIESDASR